MARFGRGYIGRQDLSPGPSTYELDSARLPWYWTPLTRMQYRQAAGNEIIHSELGNGIQFTPISPLSAAYRNAVMATPGLIGYWPLDESAEPFTDRTPAANLAALAALNGAPNPRFEADQVGWVNSTSWAPGVVTALLRSALPAGALPGVGGANYGYRIAGTKSADAVTKTLGFISDTGFYIPVTINSTYTIVMDVWVDTLPADPRFRIDRLYHDVSGTQVSSVSGTQFTLVAGWNRIVWVVTIPSTAGLVTMRINPEWLTAVASDVGDMYVTNLMVLAGDASANVPPVVTQTNHPMEIGGSSQLLHQESLLPIGEGASVGTATSAFLTWPDTTLAAAEASVYNDDLYSFAGLTPFSVEAWVRPTVMDAQRFIMAKRNTDSTGGWVLYQNTDGAVRFSRYGAAASNTAASPAGVLVPNIKHHIIVTFDGTTVRFYVDGAPIATVAQQVVIDRHGYPLTFFRDSDQVGGQFFGFMQHAALYNRALGVDDVASHYAAATAVNYLIQGTIVYGWNALSYSLIEAYADGGVQTQDWALAAALRKTGLFTELQL